MSHRKTSVGAASTAGRVLSDPKASAAAKSAAASALSQRARRMMTGSGSREGGRRGRGSRPGG
jgi:hypothetical protein